MALMTATFWRATDVPNTLVETSGVIIGYCQMDTRCHAVILPFGETTPINISISEIDIITDMRNKDFRKMLKHLFEHDDD